MDQDFNLNFKVNTSDAVQGLNNLKGAADQAAESVGKIGEKAGEAASEVSKVGDAADQSLPKVQGLGSAFESAFTSAIQLGSQTKGTLGEIFKSVNKAIPTVKQLNNTAISGLTGIKRAIAATGIGALIVAVGVLTTHWEGFLHAVGSSKEEFDQFKTKAVDALGNVVSGIVGVGNVIVQSLLTPIRLAINSLSALGNVLVNVVTGKFRQIGPAVEAAMNSVKEIYTKGFDIEGNFARGKEAGQKFVQGVITTFTYKAPEIQDTVSDTLTGGGSKGRSNQYRKAGEKAGKEFGEGLEESLVSEYQKISSEAEKILGNLGEEKHLQKIKEHLEDFLELSETQREALQDPDFGDKLQNQLAEFLLEWENTNDTLKEELEKTKILLGDPFLDEETANEYKQRYADLLQGIEDTYTKLEQNIGTVWNQSVNLMADRDLETLKRRQDLNKTYALEQVELWKTSELSRAQAIKEINEQDLENQRYYLEEKLRLLESFGKQETEEYVKIQEQLHELPFLEALVREEDRQRLERALAEDVRTYTEAAQSIASIFGTIAQAQEDSIRRRVESGKISEEEAEKEFERVKGWQIAETWINTLSGMTAALTSPIMQSAGIPGWIAAAAQAAALLANGIAQTAKIRNTSFGSGGTGGGGGASVPSVGVTPLQVTDDIQVSPSALAQSQNPAEQRVWISQADLEESHRQVEIRENASTF